MIKLPLPQFWHQKVALIKVLILHSSMYEPFIGVEFYDCPLSKVPSIQDSGVIPRGVSAQMMSRGGKEFG